MKIRRIGQSRQSTPSVDGAGVSLRRVFYREDTLDIDPFLLLDTFDSENSKDYIKGFPMHPHRGIQTFTYLIDGEIIHRDSLGNEGTIKSGEYQWMTAGSGIIHEEMPQAVAHMLGFQLWINLPRKDKMTIPSYMEGTHDNIFAVNNDAKGYNVKILSGEFEGVAKKDFPDYVKTEIYDIELKAGKTIEIPVDPEYNAFICNLVGSVSVDGERTEEKSVATLIDGDTVSLTAGDSAARVMFFAGKPLNEPVVFGGPFVMNTQEEILTARRELNEGTFIKHKI